MIFTIISIAILLYGCVNFKKGLMIFAIYQIFWYTTQIANISGLSLNTTILLTVGFSFLYLINKKKYNGAKVKFPFRVPFLLIIFSYILTCVFALSGFGTEFSRALSRIMREYIFVWILWDTIETESDFRYIFKGITIVMLFGCLYGLFEYAIHYNPILEYKVVLSSGNINLYDISGLRGYRLTSFFEHPLGAGMTFGLYAIFVFIIWINGKGKNTKKYLAIFTAFLCLLCVFLTKMRSGILFTLILAISFVSLENLKRRRFYYIIIALIMASPILYLAIGQNISIILDLFTRDTSSSIGGSSLLMRLDQFNAIANIMKMSPIAGLGETFRGYITRSSYTDAALGYESLWFEQATMHGVVGLISTVIMIYYSVIKIPKKYRARSACVFAIAYWLVYTFTSIPSFRVVLFYLAEFYFIKTSEVYQNATKKMDKLYIEP